MGLPGMNVLGEAPFFVWSMIDSMIFACNPN